MITQKTFYDSIRSLFGKITEKQLEGMEAILAEWAKRGLTDLRWLAYIFATAYHETARTMQPIAEYGKGLGKKYHNPDPKTGKIYYGRGHVQLTWNTNYKKFADLLHIDLYNNPELALQMDVSVQIMFEGMINGLFTGKELNDYFNSTTDWINARRIINGTDKAKTIADYAETFYKALTI